MTRYRVQYTTAAAKQLRKLDRFDAKLLTAWISKNLVDTDNPYRFGKSLTGDHSGKWRYRVGNYRIICVIEDETVTIHIFQIGHRKNIYNK